MAKRLFVVDSGATARLVRRLFVVDSGATSRLIRRAFVIDSGGTARQFYSGAASMSATMNEGDDTVSARGYENGGLGSLTPNTLTDGTLVVSLFYDPYSTNLSVFSLSIAADPGQGFVTTVTVGGATATVGGGSWSGYTYSGGQANWEWTGNLWGITGARSGVAVVVA